MNHHVNVISDGDVSLVLTNALLLYRSQTGDVYATSHPILRNGRSRGGCLIGPGAPATKDALAAFAQAVSEATAYSGFVPERLLYTSANLLAWWTPAAVRRTFFRTNDDELGNAVGDAAHPALVFIVQPSHWYVFALKDNARPTPSTRLYHAPHFNVRQSGEICTGNVKLPPAIGAESIGAYEDAFFRSHFTHPNRAGFVNYPGGVHALWRDQLAHPNPAAMTAALKRSSTTLKAAIERIAGDANN